MSDTAEDEETIDDGSISLVKIPNTGITLRIVEDLASCEENDGNLVEDDGDEEDDEDVEDAVGRFMWPTALPLLRHITQEWDKEQDDDEEEDNGDETTTNGSNIVIPNLIVELGSGCGVLGMGLTAAASAATATDGTINGYNEI